MNTNSNTKSAILSTKHNRPFLCALRINGYPNEISFITLAKDLYSARVRIERAFMHVSITENSVRIVECPRYLTVAGLQGIDINLLNHLYGKDSETPRMDERETVVD